MVSCSGCSYAVFNPHRFGHIRILAEHDHGPFENDEIKPGIQAILRCFRTMPTRKANPTSVTAPPSPLIIMNGPIAFHAICNPPEHCD